MRPAESFIGQPIRSLQTMLRTLAREDNGYLPLIPDGIYGPETSAAVSAFQRRHGIPVTGVTDPATWEVIVAQYEPALVRQEPPKPVYILLDPGAVLKRGQKHPHIHLVQAMLTVLADAWESISSPSGTGVLDDATADSLAAFQQLSGLPVTGHLDKVTWKHLASHYPMAAAVLEDSAG